MTLAIRVLLWQFVCDFAKCVTGTETAADRQQLTNTFDFGNLYLTLAICVRLCQFVFDFGEEKNQERKLLPIGGRWVPLNAVQSLILTELVLYVCACMCVCIREYVYACECVYVLGAAECSALPYSYGTGSLRVYACMCM